MIRRPIVCVSLGALLASAFPAPARAQESAPPFRYETQKVDDYLAQRAAALAAALGFAAWPKASELYALPTVGRGLLRNPAAVADAVRACTTVRFGDEAWPQCTWSWKGARAEGRPSPGEDWLDVQITVAPSGRAAQEHVISTVADNQLPTEMVVARYKAAERPDNLGHVAFVVPSPRGNDTTVLFLRANVVFRIRGHGSLAAEALPLARQLDEHLAGQSPLTLDALRARSRAPLGPR